MLDGRWSAGLGCRPIEHGVDRDEYPSHGHRSEPGECKPAWHDEGEWTREPRSEWHCQRIYRIYAEAQTE